MRLSRSSRARRALLLLGSVAAATAAAACSDRIVSSGSGAVRAAFTTTGTDRDIDGYKVAIDRGTPVTVGSNESFVFDGLSVGPHTLAVAGVQYNCTLTGGASRTVKVSANDTTEVAPGVACLADPGTLAVSATDAVGDTLPNGDATLAPAIDVVASSVRYKGDSIIIMLRFSAPVRPASDFAASSLNGFVEIDADENLGTGAGSLVDFYRGTQTTLGVEYAIDLFGSTPTAATMYSFSGTDDSQIALEFGGDSVTMRFARAQLVHDDGNFDFGAVIGTYERPTDFVPNSGTIVAHDPNPHTTFAAAGTVAGAPPASRSGATVGARPFVVGPRSWAAVSPRRAAR